jgi:hypothetical protein
MRILIGVIAALLVITVAFGVGFLGVFGESSSTTTAGPPPVHNAALRPFYPHTPAMAAGVSDHVWKIEEIVALLG